MRRKNYSNNPCVWLKARNTGLDVGASWDNLKISEDDGFLSPAKKQEYDDKTMMHSPNPCNMLVAPGGLGTAPQVQERGRDRDVIRPSCK